MTETLKICLAIGLVTLWCCWVFVLYRRNREVTVSGANVFVYASQTGQALTMAKQAAAGLDDVTIVSANKLSEPLLVNAQRICFYLSTYGNGEPPDNGHGLSQFIAEHPHVFENLTVSITALGDSRYPDFCAFGKEIHQQLTNLGIQKLSELTLIDANVEDSSLAAGFSTAVITQIEQLNPSSTNAPLYKINIDGSALEWQAGDLLQVLPEHMQPFSVPRSYSIASADSALVSSKTLQLIVRLQVNTDGSVGKASGYLTQTCQVGDTIKVQVKSNPACQLTSENKPLLLIGAGSGLAGLLGHIEQRALIEGSGPVWLIYGERDPEHDCHLRADLNHYRKQQVIQRIDRVFSQSQQGYQYVQQVLEDNAEALQQLLKQNGDIYVCGSLNGMGNQVHKTLISILGNTEVENLLLSARYHRDLY